MTTSWIPAPVGLLAAAAFVLVLGVHVWHAAVMVGRHRLWHLLHILMAAAMVTMYLPGDALQIPARAGVAVFAAVAVLVAAALLVSLLQRNRIGVLWLLNVADLVWMAIMFALMEIGRPWVAAAAAVWFAGQALGWASGRFGAVLEHRGLGEVDPPTHPPPTLQSRAAPARISLILAGEVRARTRAGTVDGGRHDLSVRASLTAMSVGMAYMFLAQTASANGMASMAGM